MLRSVPRHLPKARVMSPVSAAVLPLAGVLVLTAASARASQIPDSIRPGSCWDIQMGPWRPNRELGADSLEVAPPSRIRLDTARADELEGAGYALSVPSGATPSKHRFVSWRPTGRDRIGVSWSTGFSGLTMDLRVTPRHLQGQAETFWDFPRPIQRAEVRADEVRCEAPPRIEVKQRILPRSVQVQGGDSITLGQSWTSVRTRAERLRDGTYRIQQTSAGLFEGATTVSVWVNRDGIVARIDLEYATTDYAGLVAHLSQELRKPTTHDTIPISDSKGLKDELAAWDSRTTSLAVWHSNLVSGGFAVRILLIDPRL